jgi:hypothetical protein
MSQGNIADPGAGAAGAADFGPEHMRVSVHAVGGGAPESASLDLIVQPHPQMTASAASGPML